MNKERLEKITQKKLQVNEDTLNNLIKDLSDYQQKIIKANDKEKIKKEMESLESIINGYKEELKDILILEDEKENIIENLLKEEQKLKKLEKIYYMLFKD